MGIVGCASGLVALWFALEYIAICSALELWGKGVPQRLRLVSYLFVTLPS